MSLTSTIRNLVAASTICCFTGCSFKHPITPRLVTHMRVTSTNVTLLKIKGGYVSSFLQVGETKVEKLPDKVLLIQVFSQHPFFRTEGTGGIDVEVVIDDSIDVVAFGYPDRIIWRRKEKEEGTVPDTSP